jgi:hypothetical protein
MAGKKKKKVESGRTTSEVVKEGSTPRATFGSEIRVCGGDLQMRAQIQHARTGEKDL